MDATRARVSSLVEWIAALAGIAALAAIGSVLIRDFRTVNALTPVIAHEESIAEPPAAVPARSVSVPVLVLSDGSELRVGDSAVEVSQRLGPDAETAPPAIERAPSGERVTRFYLRAGQRFAVVLEPFVGDRQARVAGIYVPSSR
jgi:hypothetical protein